MGKLKMFQSLKNLRFFLSVSIVGAEELNETKNEHWKGQGEREREVFFVLLHENVLVVRSGLRQSMNDSRVNLLQTLETGEIPQTKLVSSAKELLGPFLSKEGICKRSEEKSPTRAVAGESKQK